MRLFDIGIEIVGSGLVLVLAMVMIRRRLHRDYPYFFAYIVVILVRTAVLLPITGDSHAYFYGFWTTELLTAGLVFLALYEAFYEVFYGFYVVWWFRLIFPGVACLISFFCIRYALLHPFPRAPLWMMLILSADNAASLTKAGVFLLFMILVVAFHMRWRRYPYDIVLGFAVTSIGMLAYDELWAKGGMYYIIARYGPAVTFILATAIWLWSFGGKLQDEPVQKWRHEASPEQLLQELREYMRIVRKGSGEAR